MITDADWEGGDLTAARIPPGPEHKPFDTTWGRWYLRAIQQGRSPNEAVRIAYTRTEDQYGPRPEETKP